MLATQLRPTTSQLCASAQRPTRSRASGMPLVRCDFAEGTKVRVTAPVKVYHVGKFKAGLDLQGMEGVVQADVRQYKGLELSATLPWKVQFEAQDADGKAVKVIAHLESHELEQA